jgi:catechol-2,3-dioxygenase
MNTWESMGAGKRAETLGLRSFEIILEREEDLEAVKNRLKKANIGYKEHTDSLNRQRLQLHDPWENQVILYHAHLG